MTIDEAIKHFEIEMASLPPGQNPTWVKALGLGIEALNVIKWQRGTAPSPYVVLLTGETEE